MMEFRAEDIGKIYFISNFRHVDVLLVIIVMEGVVLLWILGLKLDLNNFKLTIQINNNFRKMILLKIY